VWRTDVAGRDITRYLQLLLQREGHLFKTSSEFEGGGVVYGWFICRVAMTKKSDIEIQPGVKSWLNLSLLFLYVHGRLQG